MIVPKIPILFVSPYKHVPACQPYRIFAQFYTVNSLPGLFITLSLYLFEF